MLWFRFYHSVANNRKVQLLPARLFRTWVNLLRLASENGERGTLPAPEDLAFGLRTSAEKANIDLERLIEAGLIDRDGDELRMHDWNLWQYESDSSTPRVREHRARKNETPMKRFGNDGVTRPDKEADTEAEPEQINEDKKQRREQTPKPGDFPRFLEERYLRQKERATGSD